MERFRYDHDYAPCSKIEVQATDYGHEVRASSYCLRLQNDSLWMDLLDAEGNQWMELFRGSNVVTSGHSDTTYKVEQPRYEATENGDVVIRIASRGETGKPKEQVWVCRDNYIQTYITAETAGDIQSITLLGGNYVAPNMFGESMSQRHFNSVYNPQPSEMERPITSALESTKVSTDGMWKPGRRREFLITQPAFGFSLSPPAADNSVPEGPWLMASLSAPITEQNMTAFRYDVHDDGFVLRAVYDGTPLEEEAFTSPSMLLHFAESPLQGLQDAKRHAINLGHLREIPPPAAHDWHKGTTWVSWGEQQEQARRHSDQGVSTQARDIATQAFVGDTLEFLEDKNIPIDIYTIDDKWQTAYGTNTPDTRKWPDMPGFNAFQKEFGRRAVLWMKLFDPEGLPPELCIVNTEGLPIAGDPTNPKFLELTWEQVHYMLSQDGLNADGLKPDFIAQLPQGPGIRWHGNARGGSSAPPLS